MLKTARQLPSEPEIGQRLRALRQEKGLTLQEVARRSGISMSTISKIENDRVSPTFASLLKLAEAFEMPLTTLIGGLSPPRRRARLVLQSHVAKRLLLHAPRATKWGALRWFEEQAHVAVSRPGARLGDQCR